jgi:hypothetical protein
MLTKKPNERITAEQALAHHFFSGMDIEEPKVETFAVEMIQ